MLQLVLLIAVDNTYTPRFTVACARFVQRAHADDPDLPAARKYLEEARTAPHR